MASPRSFLLVLLLVPLCLFNLDVHLFDNYKLMRPKGILMEGRVQTAVQLSNGEIWLGSRGMGLFCYYSNFNPLPVPLALKP